MPARVEEPREAFAEFEAELFKRKFERVSRQRIARDFAQFGLQPPPRRFKGRQIGYVAHARGLTVYVWTTYLESGEGIQDSNEGWVLLTEQGKRQWCSYPLRRTKNFLTTVLWLARINRWRAAHRPCCPVCGAYMRIRFGQGFKSRYWECMGEEETPHHKVTMSWAHHMPPEAVKFERRYAATHKPTAGPQLAKRGKWRAATPGNSTSG